MTLFVLTLGIAAGAQSQRGATSSRGPGWLPRRLGVVWQELTPAERDVVTARMNEYERLFVSSESLIRPQGFRATSFIGGDLKAYPWDIPRLSYGIHLTHETPSLWVTENPAARDLWMQDSGGVFKDGEDEIYKERPKRGPLPGMPRNAVVFDGLQFDLPTQARINAVQVLLTSDGELPWADVPRERVLKILIAREEAGLKDFDKMLPALQTMPDMLAQFKKDRAQMTARVNKLRSELAAMSPAERVMPAWIQFGSDAMFKFAAPGTPGFEHLIVDKPEYYRFKGSRVQVRSLLIGFSLKDATTDSGRQADRAVTDSFKAFDWTAAARTLAPGK